MPAAELIDYSPQHPDPAEPITTANNLVLIDNYDSFTWNVYQYLVLEGAKVEVYRNDEITLDQLIELNPTQLVVSPGPGHPVTDSGISKDAIKHFSGKIPVLGVCMGEQCIYSAFGGTVSQTGEILHGKTSPLKHDGKGVYHGLAQDLPVTRYHSLAGTHPTLPDCLEVSSWTTKVTQGGPNGESVKDVIMGVRHKEYCVEGVQFHPESILTAEGRSMLKNFLRLRGGTWIENERLSKGSNASPLINGAKPPQNNGAASNGTTDKKTSILERIYDHRRIAVAAQKQIPSQRPEDLQAAYDLDLAPSLIDFTERVRQTPFQLSLLAEVKRASPSKGIINLTACAPQQARTYALAGASVISVLTEPEWFKGSIDDLRAVRRALEGMPNRPAVLRKEFIFEEYQILEARVAGADTVLLIVKMLDTETLTRLYHYSRGLDMEPLVEVNTIQEMEIAVKLGSKVIGVNNRNLTSFEVDMETTTRLLHMVGKDTLLCALSGISGPEDVVPYQKAGVGAVLVGEALMRANDTSAFIAELLGGNKTESLKPVDRKPLVKICGTRSPEAAKAAIEAGADMIGIILVEGRSRCVQDDTAKAISQVVHNTPKLLQTVASTTSAGQKPLSWSQHARQHHLQRSSRALLVGVFLNQPLDHILSKVKSLNLDVVQLHGQEPIEWASLIPVPVMHAFKPDQAGISTSGYHSLPLLDSGAGGSGQLLDMSSVEKVLESSDGLEVMLAGGLDPDNVEEALAKLGRLKSKIAGVDVSSGVETDGKQDVEKIKRFVLKAKAISL